jgi:hypothetical protein
MMLAKSRTLNQIKSVPVLAPACRLLAGHDRRKILGA